MDNPLSSILRPGPAAPANEQTSRETPIEGGDAAARRAIEQNTYPPQRTDWGGAQPQQQQPSYVPRPVVQPVAQPAAQPVVSQVQPGVRPVQDTRSAAQPAASGDDFLAGLEQAAMRDIGDELRREPRPEVARPEITRDVPRQAPAAEVDEAAANKRRERRQAKQEQGPEPGEKSGKEKRRQMRRQEARAKKNGTALPVTTTGKAVEERKEKPIRKKDKDRDTKSGGALPPTGRGFPWTAASFFAMVIIPAALAAFYYMIVASPQYRVEAQFSVRGSSQSSISTMGLPSILGGASSQTGDSYIVTNYVESLQLIRDVQQELGIDLRQFYSRDSIDWLYRISPDMPLEKFTEYWAEMTDVSFNSTTGNTTLYIYGFSAEDSKAIADAVLKVSEKLVNQLSESNRQQVMQVASKQVDRAEERLRKVQGEIRRLRVEEKITDPNTLITLQNQVTSSIQGQLNALKTRMTALRKSVDADAPQVKVLQNQIDAQEQQLAQHEAQLGTLAGKDPKDMSPEEKANLAEVLNKFEELTIEQGFATQAYTTALAAFETAIVEAQRQERYFATFVQPVRPEIALYPMRGLDTFIAFLVLLAVWMVTQFLYRSFRDHAI